MRRLLVVLSLVAILTVAFAAPAAARPPVQPGYDATLSVSSKCVVTAKATAPKNTIAYYVRWQLFRDDFPVGGVYWTIINSKNKTATFTWTATKDTASHEWYAWAQWWDFARTGTVSVATTDIVTVKCF